MNQHQIIHKLLLVQVDIISADAVTTIERSVRFQPVELILGPDDCILKSLNHRLQKGTVRLTNISNSPSKLIRAIGNGQLRLDRFEIGCKQSCRLGAIRQTDLSRNIWRHIRITIAIASHPRCKLDRGNIQGQTVLRAKLGLHRDIQLPEEGGDRIPKDGLNNERAALGLHLRRWLATAHLITLPDGRDFAVETVIEQTLTVGREWAAGPLGVGLGEDLLYALLLVEDGPAIHFGGMRRQDQLDRLVDEGIVHVLGIHAHLLDEVGDGTTA
mmetsp:Transcript_26803/g.77285  ORF Transcript_26803/g.77285 Transcript_26803/m.77285 type:complete len:271 (+) Transcript_26803:528-1340(+)